MKCRWFINILLLGVFLSTPNNIFAGTNSDSLLLERLFHYSINYTGKAINDYSDNIYLKYSFNTIRRNPTLFLIPTMYTIAKGKREHVGETYGRISFKDIYQYDIKRQVVTGSLSNYRKTMPIVLDYLIPDLYSHSLFDEHILSPFNQSNKRYYRYKTEELNADYSYLSFRPYLNNTQLVRGTAVVHKNTGRIKSVFLRGEYDMIKFEINTDMGDSTRRNPFLPLLCETKASFKFLGNKIKSKFSIALNCNTTLPDTMSAVSDMTLMDSIRPYPLGVSEKNIYSKYEEENAAADTTRHEKSRNRRIRDMAWDFIGDNFISSIHAETSKATVRLSPLLNPLYLSYSHRRGLSYKIRMGARYRFNPQHELSFTPQLGYNFKIKKLFYTTPIRYTYNTKKDAWVEFSWQNGNRITNSSVLDLIKDEKGDTINFASLNLDYFDDEIFTLRNNVNLSNKVNLTVGCVYHRRKAVDGRGLQLLGKPTSYNSFAPQVTLGYQPAETWPKFTANYERGINGVLNSNIEYERMEFDASYKKKLRGLRIINIRGGGGLYTNKSSDYFVDFSNFHENYLPDGWDDDWTGNFQLLNSQWYNASTYYARINTSYESPLLLLSWLPWIGKYFETERIYASALQIEHISPYFEVGYGFTTRYFSIGVFGSFVNRGFNSFGSKFTFELFRKW